MWPPGTAKVWPTSAAVAAVVSSSTADVNTSGTGGWTLQVYGLDAAGLEVSETVNLTGQTPVNTTQTFLRINRAIVLTAGTGQVNAGNISITVGGNLQAYIEAGESQTHQTHFTVPANKVFVIDHYSVGVGRMAGSSDIQVAAFIRLNMGVNDEAWRAISDQWLYNGEISNNASSATVLPPLTDAKQVITSTSTTQAFSIFSGYLVKVGAF